MASLSDLLGTWKLVSWSVEVMDTGEKFSRFGAHPSGFLQFTPGGRMFAILTAEERRPIETDADQIAAFESLVAYTGQFRIEEDRIITTVDVAADPDAVGKESLRYFDLTGDTLTVRTPPFRSSKPSLRLGDRPLQSLLVWTRSA
jgi:hypothetical protein